jgi:NADH-quinone oxidoreductase subunit M
MLVGIIYLRMQNPTGLYDLHQFSENKLDGNHQSWIFWAFFLAFAIKMPIFPFHTWQPDTYTEAPSAGTMMLSGIMLKMGIYGVIRWLIPIAPLGVQRWGFVALILSVVGIVYASVIAFRQKDGKRLVAYSSIAHVGLISAALFTFIRPDGAFIWTVQSVQGVMIQMLNHGINVVGLFFIWDIIGTRMNTREIGQLGGIAKVAPKFAIAFLIITLGTVALPLTNGFIGEFLLLNGVFQYNIWIAALAGLPMIFGAVYMLRMYKTVMQGETNALTATFADISGSERVVLAVICILIIAVGIYPQPILHLSDAAVSNLVNSIHAKVPVK